MLQWPVTTAERNKRIFKYFGITNNFELKLSSSIFSYCENESQTHAWLKNDCSHQSQSLQMRISLCEIKAKFSKRKVRKWAHSFVWRQLSALVRQSLYHFIFIVSKIHEIMTTFIGSKGFIDEIFTSFCFLMAINDIVKSVADTGSVSIFSLSFSIFLRIPKFQRHVYVVNVS